MFPWLWCISRFLRRRIVFPYPLTRRVLLSWINVRPFWLCFYTFHSLVLLLQIHCFVNISYYFYLLRVFCCWWCVYLYLMYAFVVALTAMWIFCSPVGDIGFGELLYNAFLWISRSVSQYRLNSGYHILVNSI